MDNNIAPDGGYGYVIVLATTLITISVRPLSYVFGIIFLSETNNIGILTTSQYCVYYALALLGSPLLKSYDFRKVALLGTSLMCLGIFITCFVRSFEGLIGAFSILYGVGHGLMLVATYTATNTYFKKRLTLAIAFSETVIYGVYLYEIHICNKYLLNLDSYKTALLIFAGISLLAIVCCFLLKPLQQESVTEEVKIATEDVELQNINDQVCTTSVNRNSLPKKIYKLFNLELFKNRPYVVALVVMSLSMGVEQNTAVRMSYAFWKLANFDLEDSSLAGWLEAIVTTATCFIAPPIAYCFGLSPRIIYGGSLLLSTVARIVIAIFYGSRMMAFLGVFLIRVARGCQEVYHLVVIPKLVSLEQLPAAYGFHMVLTCAAYYAWEAILDAIEDVSGSFVYTLHASSIVSAICVVTWVVSYFKYEQNTERTS